LRPLLARRHCSRIQETGSLKDSVEGGLKRAQTEKSEFEQITGTTPVLNPLGLQGEQLL
jgi:hypothetical protein